MEDLDFSRLRELGWDVRPVYTATKDRHVITGGADEVFERVDVVETQYDLEREREERREREQRDATVNRLVGGLQRVTAEHSRAWQRYIDSGDVASLGSAVELRQQQAATFRQLLDQPLEHAQLRVLIQNL